MELAQGDDVTQTTSPREGTSIMESGEEPPVDGEAHERSFIVSGDGMDRIVRSLTVVHGYVQLVRRRTHQQPTSGSDGLERALTQMKVATRAMAAELYGTMRATSRPRGDTGPD